MGMRAQSISLSAASASGLSALLCHVLAHSLAAAPTVPQGFSIDTVASGLSLPVAMAIAPDGRLFVTEKATGWVRVVHPDSLLARPFIDLPVNSCGERGALGIAVDPDFADNGHLFVLYTLSNTGDDSSVRDSVVDHRIVRFTASGDTALAGSETLVRSLPAGLCVHNGGNIHFGPDGALYVTLGDENLGEGLPLDLGDLRGKLLRLDPATGEARADNFFAADGDSATLGEIWAYGLRNSFDFCFHPASGALLATENGQASDDEINHLVERGNYGWPLVAGPADTPEELAYAAGEPTYRDPVWSSGSITTCPTGIVVAPSPGWSAFLGPSLLVGQCNPFGGSRQIIRFPLIGAAEDSLGGPAEEFATGFGLITDLEFDAQERLYVCTWSVLWRIVLDDLVDVDRCCDPATIALRVLGSPSSETRRARFATPSGGAVRLTLHDVRGRRVRRWEWSWLPGGEHEVLWDGSDERGRPVPPGVYFLRLLAAGSQASCTAVRTR